MKNGDWVKVDYSGWRAADNALVETTSAEEAKKAGAFDEKAHYAPSLVIIGSGTALKGIEDALLTMNVGESRKLELAPENAFGLRDPSIMRVMPLADFRKREIEPYPGLSLEIDNKRAYVRSVNSGRVTIDFNHPLAGEKVVYEVKLLAAVDGVQARAQELLARSMRGAAAGASVALNGDVLQAKFGEGIAKDMDFIISKAEFISDVLRHVPEVKKIEIVEEYVRKENKQS